jgi:glycosyltransferase involved in cell wall biosynthesis
LKKFLIEGWRGVNHSFAMVNQHQILALARLGEFDIYHKDIPFFMSHWDEKLNGAGFDKDSAALIAGLSDLPVGSADAIYRITAPIRPTVNKGAMEITFIVTELGLDLASFSSSSSSPGTFTEDGNIVVTPSRWSRDRLLDYGFDERSVRVIGHGVDTIAFNPLTAEERRFNRTNLGIPPDTTVFLNVGAPIWNKGGDLLVEAFARVHRRHPGTRLILKDARQLYGLSAEETVRQVGVRHPELITDELVSSISLIQGNMTQAELRLLYGLSDWYVSPYRAEGFNLPVLEALACGRPVIITSGGATDDFCHGPAVRRIPSTFHRGLLPGTLKQGCHLEPHLPELVELMIQAIKGSEDHQPLSAMAVEQAKIYSWAKAAKGLAGLLP